jgi:hypothetical protein
MDEPKSHSLAEKRRAMLKPVLPPGLEAPRWSACAALMASTSSRARAERSDKARAMMSEGETMDGGEGVFEGGVLQALAPSILGDCVEVAGDGGDSCDGMSAAWLKACTDARAAVAAAAASKSISRIFSGFTARTDGQRMSGHGNCWGAGRWNLRKTR